MGWQMTHPVDDTRSLGVRYVHPCLRCDEAQCVDAENIERLVRATFDDVEIHQPVYGLRWG